jgi:hypothetical protein
MGNGGFWRSHSYGGIPAFPQKQKPVQLRAGLVFDGDKVMHIGLMLESTSTSLLIEERSINNIVIGVPHHAPAGKKCLPCPEHKDSDENAGFLGRYIAEELDCCSVIACNYTMDVNKCSNSDYAVQIAKWKPRVLVEIHGHGGEKTNKGNHIEISSGSKKNELNSNTLAEKLREKLSEIEQLKNLIICGEFDSLQFQASKTATITDHRWKAFHIELPPSLRIVGNGKRGKPPQSGYKFCDYLVESLEEMGLHKG